VNPPATTVAYFGPAATFTHEALLTQPDLATADPRPLGSITAVLESVARGEVDLGFVPIENAIEGTVSATIDGLIHDVDLHIQRGSSWTSTST
jgi:prephenate dehydratase